MCIILAKGSRVGVEGHSRHSKLGHGAAGEEKAPDVAAAANTRWRRTRDVARGMGLG